MNLREGGKQGKAPETRLRRSVIGRRLATYFAAVMLPFVASGIVYYLVDRDMADTRDWSRHTYQVLNGIAQLNVAVRAQESGLRGYLLTGKESMLGDYESGQQTYERVFRELRFRVDDNPSQIARLERLDDLHRRWLDSIAKPAITAMASGQAALARQPLSDGRGPQVLADIFAVLNELARHENGLLTQRNNAMELSRWRAQMLIFGMVLLGLLAVIAALFMVRRRIVRPLNDISTGMRIIAEGDLGYEIPHLKQSGEIGDNARALAKFQHTARREESMSWVREHLAKLSYSIQQADSAAELAENLLDMLVPMLGAQYGALYQFEQTEERYRLAGAYGLSASQAASGFARGEGLAGQAARTAKLVTVDDLPVDYIRIESATGHAQPRQLVIVPGQYAEQVLAVMEIASLDAFRGRHLQLLEALMPIVAVAFSSLAGRSKTEQLLAVTREQSERLRQRELEVRQTNKELRKQGQELRAQSEALQASEEELRVQAEELQATNEELRQNTDELEIQKREVTAARDELAAKAVELEKLSRYKSEFLANMSHELRTPLNSLLILSRSLSDNRRGNLTEDQLEAAQTIHQSGRNLLELINDILDLSKVEAGKLRVNAAQVSLASVLANLRRNFDPVATDRSLQFDIQTQDGLPEHLFTDPGRLEQILRNLLSNAFKFTHSGTVSLTVSRPDDLELRDGALNQADALAFAVQDDGIGIPADRCERIFQAFEQVDASTSRVYGGTGLGLSISRHLAALLGGEIHLQSEQGKGSCFTLVIPERLPGEEQAQSLQEPVVAAAPAAPSGQVSTVSPEILIVEDDPAFARILAQEAGRKGFATRVASDGETALAAIRRQLPTAIFLDIGLPDMDGLMVLEKLRADPATAALPVHIVSAADDDGRARALGASGYLEKPVEPEALSRVLSSLMPTGASGRKLLVVDDDAVTRKAVASLLADEPVQVEFAKNGEQGLALMRQTAFDCVLLDLNLPDISGFEILEQMADQPKPPPVIVFSARELSDDEMRRLRAHTDSIVIKGERATERLLDEVNLFLHRIDEPARSGARPVDATTVVELAGRKVLVVDDDMRNTFALSRILREQDMQVIMAQDGRKALQQLDEQPQLDIVLMDIMMPVMDGYETMREIRKQRRFANLPIIALTAKAMEGDRQKCIDAGANDYLSKPLDIDKLLSLMRAWIR